MKRLLIAAITAVLAASCTSASDPPAPPPGAVQEEVAELWTADTRTVLTGAAARRLADQCSRVSPGPVESVWTPNEADTTGLENELVQLLASEGESPSPGDYHRQYAGFVIGGRHIISVNGVHSAVAEQEPSSDNPFNWRTQAIRICDGGMITFGVEYDTATQRFRNFAFNGWI